MAILGKITTRHLATLLQVMGTIAALSVGQGAFPAVAQTKPAVSPSRVDDFFLADQNLLGHQLYRMRDAKAVVLISPQMII